MAVSRVAALTGGFQDLAAAVANPLTGLVSITETYEAIFKEVGPSDNHFGPTNLRVTSFLINVSITLDDETIGRGLKGTTLPLKFTWDNEVGQSRRLIFGTVTATDFMKWGPVRDVNFPDPRAAGPTTRYQVDGRFIFGPLADFAAVLTLEDNAP